jgi:hypothetical protein
MYIGQYPSDCLKVQSDSHYLVKYPASKRHCPEYHAFRSVIYRNDHTPVCFSPPKSIPFHSFNSDSYRVEEFVEGTMINVFYDTKWIISTKTKINAKCNFDSSLSFSDMFYECMEHVNLSFNQLNKTYTYSFVMQHPSNRIITVIPEPKLVIVAVYEIIGELVYEREIPFFAPTKFNFSLDTVLQKAQELNGKGLVIKGHDQRCKIRNINHENIEKIKGPLFNYHYLCIRNTENALIYFMHFPENKFKGEHIEYNIKACAAMLYSSYVECFIQKKKLLKTYMCSTYLYEVHGIYLKQKPICMNQQTVLNYVNSLSPARLITLLRLWF